MSLQAVDHVLTLAERKERILDLLGRTALHIGAELIAAKAEHPLAFTAWVKAEMPWGLDTAERFMAVTRAFASTPAEVRDQLPKPYSVLFELTKLPPTRLQQAIEAKEVTPTTTVVQARALRAEPPEPLPPVEQTPEQDRLAMRLMHFPSSTLDPEVLDRIKEWLQC